MQRKKQIQISLIAILLISIALFVFSIGPTAMAYDHDQTYNANATYFVPEDIRASGYCDTENVEIWINTSVGVVNGQVEFDYDYSCANVTSVTINTADWDSTTNILLTNGKASIAFSTGDGLGHSGKVKIADITIHCCNTSDCCGTNLIWHTTNTYLFCVDGTGVPSGLVQNVNLADGTFLCGDGVTLTKKVWDGSNWVDAVGPLDSSWKGKDVRFKITVTAGCLDLSNVVVLDTMPATLVYNNSANPGETSNTTSTATWDHGPLSAHASTSIEFNATIVDYGLGYNTAAVTGTVIDLGIDVTASDQASVTTMPPAGIEVNKTVWNPAKGEWVDVITSELDYVNIGNLTSEEGHDLQEWSDNQTGVPYSGSNYGGGDDGTFRLLLGPGDSCGTGCTEDCRNASFTMTTLGMANSIQLRNLDGSQNDNFTLYIKEADDSLTHIGDFVHGTLTEDWVTTTFDFPDRTGTITFVLKATGDVTGFCDTYGQVAFSWAKLLGDGSKIGDTYRFRCEMHNTGSPGMDLTDIRFWDRMSNSLEYANNATVTTPNGVTRDITLAGNYIFKPRYLHLLEGIDAYTSPIGSSWHELWPEYCNIYNITEFHDNGDGHLSYCDQIYMQDDGWYHVDRVMFTLHVENETTSEEMYLDSAINYYPGGLTDPIGMWHEIYPDFCKDWNITDWTDTDGLGIVNFSDMVYIENLHDCGMTGWYHVLNVTIDLEVSREYLIDSFLQDPLTLVPCETVTVEFDATVVDYGLDCNHQYAKGWCDDVGQWVYGEDDACINTKQPDLISTDITVNYDASSVKNKAVGPRLPGTKTQSNNIAADVTEQNGVDVLFPFDVTFSIDGVPKCTVTVPNLAASDTTTVYCDNSFFPIADTTYTITVTVDSGSVIPEADEANNDLSESITAVVNGYKGDGWQDGRNVTALQCHEEGTINLTYSVGDSAYVYNAAWTEKIVNWTPADFSIPLTESCIKKARLYVYYHGYYKDVIPNPWDYFTMDFNGHSKTSVANYWDARDLGASMSGYTFNYPYGMTVYDVTNEFLVTSGNTATLNTLNPGHTLIDSMLLVVVYNNTETEPDRIIWFNEGYDYIYARDSYAVSSEEASSYAEFEGCEPINISEVVGAKLITVAPYANEGGDENRLYFNDGEWHGVWNAGTQLTSAPFSIAETDVRDYLQATDNMATFQSHKSGPSSPDKGDSMAASNAFLIVETGTAATIEAVPPDEDCISPVEQFDVLVNITPMGAPVYGAQYKLSFNSSIIHAEWQIEGNFLNQGGVPTIPWDNTIDNDEGFVSFGLTRTGPTGATQPGTLAKIHFTAMQPGNSSLTFSDVELSDPDNYPVALHILDSYVEVCDNQPPTAIAKCLYKYNNVGTKYKSETFFDGSESFDVDGSITNFRWNLGDGNNAPGETYVHRYGSYNWNGNSYDPFTVILTVEDNGVPMQDDHDEIEVIVYYAGDTTGNGIVNVYDGTDVGYCWGMNAASYGGHWETYPRGDRADLNNDGTVDIYDGVIVCANWGHGV